MRENIEKENIGENINIVQKRNALQVMLRLIVLIKPLIHIMALAVALGVLGFLAAIAVTVLPAAYGLSKFLSGNVGEFSLQKIFVCVAACALARGILRYGEQYCNHYIAFKLLAIVRDKVFMALRVLCPAKLERKDKGNLIAIITSDVELLEVFYAHTISPIMIAICVSAVMTVFISRYHIALGAVALVSYLCIGIALPLLISKLGKNYARIFRDKSGELGNFVLDSLRGIREVLQYSNQNERLSELDDKTAKLIGTEAKMKNASAVGGGLTNVFVIAASVAMLCAASLLYMHEKINFEGMLVSLVAIMSSFGPVIALSNLGSTLGNTLAAGNRILDILDEKPETQDVSDGVDIEFDGAEFSGVDFAYKENEHSKNCGEYSESRSEKILSNVSMQIPKSKILGVCGKSGSGKSTMMRLLMRFWDVQNGSVKISGTDVRNINTSNLRNMISFMKQDTELFHDTIAGNVRIAKLDASQDEIEAACQKASVHDFIMSLPQGYDTQVGELGDTLSGGERQRLGLARVFLHDAPLMLLDEPTSNLDSLNEAVILRSLKTEMQEKTNKTAMIVSHRASTMSIADEIFEMEKGILKK